MHEPFRTVMLDALLMYSNVLGSVSVKVTIIYVYFKSEDGNISKVKR